MFKYISNLINNKINCLPAIALILTNKCNSRCRYCSYWRSETINELSEQDISKIIPDLISLQTKYVALSGGEPLLYKNIFLISKIIRDSGLKTSLISNGLLLNEYAEKIISSFDSLIISIDSFDNDTYKSIRGVDGLKIIENGIKIIKNINKTMPIIVRTIISKYNFDQLQNILDKSKSLCIDHISFLKLDYFSNAFCNNTHDYVDMIVPFNKLSEFRKLIKEFIEENKMDFKNGFIQNSEKEILSFFDWHQYYFIKRELKKTSCLAPWFFAVINENNFVKQCFFQKELGNLKENSLINILNSKEVIKERSNCKLFNSHICSFPLQLSFKQFKLQKVFEF